MIDQLSSIYFKTNERIFFMGSLTKYNDMLNHDKVQNNVNQQRKCLLDHIVTQNTSFTISQLV